MFFVMNHGIICNEANKMEIESTETLLAWLAERERQTMPLQIVDEILECETSVAITTRKKPKLVFSKEAKEARFLEEHGICQWCKLPITVKAWDAHHILPRSWGGGNEPENLMVLHHECHMNPDVFAELHLGMLKPKAFT
jgi:5-methylcytosine-specific restriction endonuclease McrA